MPQKFLVIPDTVQFMFVTTVASKSVYCVTHALVPAGSSVTPAFVTSVFDSIKGLWGTNLGPLCSTTTFFQPAFARDLRAAGLPLVQATSAAVAGTASAADTLPRQIAACLTIRTNRAGRKYRGRNYWAGFAETANGADNHMSTAAKTAIDAFAAGFIAAHNVNGIQLGVAHRPTAYDDITGLPISPGLGFTTPATQVVCRDNVWDSQRRRAS